MRHHLTRLTTSLFFISFLSIVFTSCATIDIYKRKETAELPPILSQDEIIRPYSNIGRIQVAIDLYIRQTPDLNEWGQQALREEAARMGADAVMFPEFSSRPAPHLVIPAQEYRATGVAIRFK